MSQVTAELTTALKVDILNGRHTWTADEPIASGETDSGTNPAETTGS